MPVRVLVTGASGFIGGHLVRALCDGGVAVRAMLRRPDGIPACDARSEPVLADLLDPPSLVRACTNADVVVHCAGHAHAHGAAGSDAAPHFETNLVGTRNLAEAAVAARVSRLVFLSSVKALGPPGNACADEDWPVPPATPYGRAKREAEAALRQCAAEAALEVVILRLAMVYGPGSRGNLERMARGIRAGWFPPLPETGQGRSMIHVADVVGAIMRVIDDSRATGRTYIVTHPHAYSGAELQAAMRDALGLAPQRWSVPAGLLRALGRVGDLAGGLMGRRFPFDGEVVERLLGPERYDASAIRSELGWAARVSLEDGLRDLFAGGRK